MRRENRLALSQILLNRRTRRPRTRAGSQARVSDKSQSGSVLDFEEFPGDASEFPLIISVEIEFYL